MSNTQTADVVTLSSEELSSIIDAFNTGATIGDIANISDAQLEPLYALARQHYSAGNYKDAVVLFKALCLYNHGDSRFWLGLGGCWQAEEQYQQAVEAYSMAGIASGLADPTPFFYSAFCFLKMNDVESAKVSLDSLTNFCDEANPEHNEILKRAKDLLDILNK